VEGVTAMGGFGDSDFALAAGPVAQRAGIPFVTSGATLPSLPQQIGDDFFMACYGDDVQAAAVADFAIDALGARRVWLLRDPNADFTVALAGYFKERYSARGGRVSSEEDLPAETSTYGPLVRTLRAAVPPADAVFAAALPNEAGPLTRALRDAGFGDPILSGDGFDTPELLEVAGPAANGVFYSTHVAYDEPAPPVQRFVADYRAAFGSPPESAFAALGYDTLNLIANAIGRAGSTDPLAVRDALAATRDFPAVTGTISYAPDRRTPIKPVTIVEVKDGAVTFVQRVTPG
jgi:branched-chain amino acid transport system substrate-binding protein